MTTLAGVRTVVRLVPPVVPPIAPTRAVLDVPTPAHRAVHRRQINALLVITRAREAATIRALRSAHRAVVAVALIAAQGDVLLLVPIPARLRLNKVVAGVDRNVRVDVIPLVLQAVVEDAPRRVAAHAALTA